ncbi:MAG: NAD-dependent epimerase/dehydratase family protein, partial [Mariprofundales bacterium]|nr:NAD-dependent epimerase/dehydratase family protein [Mariprofundales bacterium]
MLTLQHDTPIFVAGHRGLVGSALLRTLQNRGYSNLLLRTSVELDLRDAGAVDTFFAQEQPQLVILAAARVGGIHANNSYPADFIRDNLQIQNSVIDAAHRNNTKKLLFLGSSCIYPRMAPQPIREEALLTGALEPTNEWYAIAKIAGIKMCQAYRRQYGFNAISAMPTNLYGPDDNFDLQRSHVLPAMMRKFHLAKLAAADDLQAIIDDERMRGTIPNETLTMLGLERRADELRKIADPKVQL